MQMNFMQNRHILPVRPKKRCLFPKGDGTPEATGASRGEKRTESGSLAGPYDAHRLSGKWGRCPILDRKSTRLNSSHSDRSRMPSSA